MADSNHDIIIIGGGIVGLATAMRLTERFPKLNLILLEKEPELATHQTGHNSGVIHSGLYYKPGSVKARTCVMGRKALLEFCDRDGIPYELCGKVVVATHEEELPRLGELYRRGVANGVEGLEIIGPEKLREIEPSVKGIRALRVPTTGLIDFSRVAFAYASRFKNLGGQIKTSHQVTRIVCNSSILVIETEKERFSTKHLINCGGLFSDRLAHLMESNTTTHDGLGIRIIPFRGEYYQIIPERAYLVKRLIYPVPDPNLPFLGAHLTRTIHGKVEVGPNAVLGLAREGYRKKDVNLMDIREMFSFPGFWRMACRHWKHGLRELHRSLSKDEFVKELQRFLPDVRRRDLIRGRTGVRAQAVSMEGNLIDDFVIRQSDRAVHVLNAPSPAATSSLAIADTIVETAAKRFEL